MNKSFVLIAGILFVFNFTPLLKAQRNLILNPEFEYGPGMPNCPCYSAPTYQMSNEFDNDILNWKSARQRVANCFYNCIPSPDWVEVGYCKDNACNYIYDSPSFSMRFIQLLFRPAVDGFFQHGEYSEGIRIGFPNGNALVPKEIYELRIKLAAQTTEINLETIFTQWGEHWESDRDKNQKWTPFRFGFTTLKPYYGYNHEMNHWYAFRKLFTVPANKDELKNLVLMCRKGDLHLDDVELFEWCPNLMYIQDREYYNLIEDNADLLDEPVFEAINIVAGRNVDPTQEMGDVVVKSETNILYRFEETCNLKDGFILENGAEFNMERKQCGGAEFPTPEDAYHNLCLYNDFTYIRLGNVDYDPMRTYTWTANPASAIHYLKKSANVPNPANARSPVACIPISHNHGRITYTLTVTSNGVVVGTPTNTVIDYWPKGDISTTSVDDPIVIGKHFEMEFNLQYNIDWIEIIIFEGSTSKTILDEKIAIPHPSSSSSINTIYYKYISPDLSPGAYGIANNFKILCCESVWHSGDDNIIIPGKKSTTKKDSIPDDLATSSEKQKHNDLIKEGESKTINEEGNNNSEDIRINIHPNPNKGSFTLELSGTDELFNVEIGNVIGDVVYRKEDIKNKRLNIDISSYPTGIYFVKAFVGDEVFVEKIVYQ